jgi:hypothetical protein
MPDIKEYFGDVVFAYTDAQAVADGVLVDISAWNLGFRGRAVNRMTRTVWNELEPFAQVHVDAGLYRDVAASMKHMVATKLEHSGEGDGDVVKVPPGYWLLENELGGWTLMRPEDY